MSGSRSFELEVVSSGELCGFLLQTSGGKKQFRNTTNVVHATQHVEMCVFSGKLGLHDVTNSTVGLLLQVRMC